MLRSITLDNFRAFRHVDVNLSKLNVFVGPNNSGKSSIISAVNLIAQNVKRGAEEFSLALNGPYAELGTYYDVVHGHSARSNLGISFRINNYKYEYKFRYRTQRREIELARASVTDGDGVYLFSRTGESSKHTMRSKKRGQTRELPNARARFYGLFLLPPSAVFRPHQDQAENELYRYMRDFNYRCMSALDQHFSDFDCVGAFRAAPERTYHYTGEAPSKIGRFGENFAQMLASSASTRQRAGVNVARRVAEWFAKSGIANDLKIKPLTNRHFEILVQDRTGSMNNIIDSGFGCSQVLPILVAGFNLLKSRSSMRRPMFVAQEPEIHLHPTAAAHLGTYFTELAIQGVQCFVETHSENIVLRIARHVALGDLSPDDVRIYWVSSGEGSHEATYLPLQSDGSFSIDWPEGFFPTRADETLQLARAASGFALESPSHS